MSGSTLTEAGTLLIKTIFVYIGKIIELGLAHKTDPDEKGILYSGII